MGNEIMPAIKRGLIMRLMGSTAIISMLANCSVAFIRPISAVKADPARPENNNAVKPGANSRTYDKEGKTPKEPSAPKSTKVI